MTCKNVITCNDYLKKILKKTKKIKMESKKLKTSKKVTKVKKQMAYENKVVDEKRLNEIVIKTESKDIENRSYVQNTYLNNFNQFGQFRIWYV